VLIKFKRKTAPTKNDKPKYASLDAVMDYSRDFSIFYSGVESGTYFDGCYDMGIRNFLMSYHYIRTRHLSFSDYSNISLFIDSGAHTYQNDPKYCKISEEEWENHVAKYIKWAEKNRNLIFTIVNCDFENMVRPETVNRWNEQYFEPFMLKTGIPVCFVWHQNSYHDWDYYCKRYPYVGFSSVNTEGISIEMSEYKNRLRTAEKYNTLVHGFGMTRTSMLPELPFYTVDSTSWKSGFRYGQIAIWNGKKVQMFGKEDLQTKVFPITRTYKDLVLDEEKIINYYEPEVLRANVYAYIKAEEYINQRLKKLVYWKKAKPVKTDINNLPFDFFPSADWVLGGETDFDLKEQAKKMNVNPDLEQGLDVLIADMTMLLNWDNPEYEVAKENYILEDYAIIKSLHDTYINRIVSNAEERIEELVDFFKECLSGENDTLLQLGTNFDRLVKERKNYVEEDNTEVADLTKDEILDKVHNVLRMDNLLTDGEDTAPEIDSLDDEIFKKANIIPIRDSHGRLIKGQTTRRISKKVYSDKYPKFACDTCLAANNCPEYKAGYVCAYNKMFKRFDTRDMNDLIDIMYGMVEHNVGRMQMAMLQETLTGNVGDPRVTNFINQNINLVNTLISLRERQNSLTVKQTRTYSDGTYQEVTQVTNPQSGGILEKLFGNNTSESGDKKSGDKKSGDKKAATKDIVEA